MHMCYDCYSPLLHIAPLTIGMVIASRTRTYGVAMLLMMLPIMMVMLSSQPQSSSLYVAAYQSHTLTRKSGQAKSLEATAPSVAPEEDSSSSDEPHISEQTATGNVETIQTPEAPKDISLFYPSECPTSNRSVIHHRTNSIIIVVTSNSALIMIIVLSSVQWCRMWW